MTLSKGKSINDFPYLNGDVKSFDDITTAVDFGDSAVLEINFIFSTIYLYDTILWQIEWGMVDDAGYTREKNSDLDLRDYRKRRIWIWTGSGPGSQFFNSVLPI